MGVEPRIDGHQLLARVSFLQDLDRRDREALLSLATTIRYEPRDAVVRKGDIGTQLFGILRGRVKAVTSSPEGRELTLSIMGPGEVFGEIALLDNAERSATIVVLDECELLCIRRADFLRYLERHPRVAIKLLGALASQMRRLTRMVEDTVFLNLPIRLARKLLDLADQYGRRTAGGVRIELRLPQQELADMVGTSRESINKQMRAWSDEGIIVVERTRITIARRDQLEVLARSFLM